MVESNELYNSVFDSNITSITKPLSTNLSSRGNAYDANQALLKFIRSRNANNLSLLPPILIMLLVCLLLNSIVVIIIAFEKRLHKPANAYILSLSCVDFLTGCISIVNLLYGKSLRESQLPKFFCYASSFLDPVVAHADLNHILLMSYDRYSAITYPLTYSRPNRKYIIALQVSVSYAVALVVWGSPLIVYGYNAVGELGTCGLNIPRKVIVILLCLVYFGSYSALLFFYGRCMWCIWTQFYRVKPLINKTKTAVSDRRKIHPTGVDISEPKASLSTKIKTVALEFADDISVSNETETTIVGVTIGSEGEAETLPAVNVRPEPSRNQVGTSDQASNKRRNNLIRSIRNVGVYVGAFTLLIMPYPMYLVASGISSIISGETTEAWNISLAEIIGRIITGDASPVLADYVNRKLNERGDSPLTVRNIIEALPYVHTNVHPLLFMLTQREFRIAVKTMFKKLSKCLHR